MMDWRVAVVALIITVWGEVQGVPVITSDGQTIGKELGQTATMTCVVRDLGAASLNWVFTTQSLTIFRGNQKQTMDSKYSLEHYTDSGGNKVYTLLISPLNVADQGVYKCEVSGTSTAVIFQLNITDSPVPSEVQYTPDGPLNRTDCCKERGVSDACLPVCAPTSTGSSVNLATCTNDLAKFVVCGTDGRNHESCCARNGLPTECLKLCNYDPVNVLTLSSIGSSCLTTAHFQTVVSCYQYGGALTPSPPESVSVLHSVKNGRSQLLVSWKKPTYNPSAVLGYLVFYKNGTDSKYQTTVLLDPSVLQYALSVETNAMYSLYVVAVGHHGSSQASQTVDITTMDTTSSTPSLHVDICCGERKVSASCQQKLCEPRLWETFDTSAMLDCYEYLETVFTCLAGRRDHSACCQNHHVPEECVPMCSGSPPPFNTSLAVCVPKLPVIAACVQQGLSTQRMAPDGISLKAVTAHTATVTWADPAGLGVQPADVYYVQLRRGNENAPWATVIEVVGLVVELTNLTESEKYAVQVIARVGNSSSLPSAVVHFQTPPETTPSFRPTVAHNITQCCEETGMPAVCSKGCEYKRSMTAYYLPHLDTCKFFIGSVLTCAADGRDHTPCCIQRGVQELCHGMCVLNSLGFLNPKYLACLNETADIVECFSEGIEDLVRMPEEVMVTNETSHTLSLQWKNPETGPTPEKYVVQYTDDNKLTVKQTTTDLMVVLQNLRPGTSFSITVTSFLNGSSSPPTNPVTTFTPTVGTGSPFVPVVPTNFSRALWNNRTHCCESSGIRKECQPLCLNKPSTAANCNTEKQKILACATDGRDHSVCCRQKGLVETCVPLCSGRANASYSVRQAGCLGVGAMNIITSCMFENTGLLPAMPQNFTAVSGNREVTLQWGGAANCNSGCAYDVHYWRTNTADPGDYKTKLGVTSPHTVTGLTVGGRFTFTVTARVINGSGPAAPWQTLYFGIMGPDISIAQQSTGTANIYEPGTSVTLICEVLYFPHPLTYTWYYRGRALNTRDRIYRLASVDKPSEGNYTCKASIEELTLSASTFVNVRYIPQNTNHRVDSVRPNVGGQAIIEFWFRGHPLIDAASTVWTKNGDPVQQSGRYSVSAQTNFQTGLTRFKLKIQNVVPPDYGSYKCRAANQYGYATVITVLMNPDNMPTPVPPTPEEKNNMTACCRASGVHQSCLPLCSRAVSVEEAMANQEKYGFCLLYFNSLVKCAADGADHSLCCDKNDVDRDCLTLCKGQAPSTQDIINMPQWAKCVPESPKILNCMETGFGKIPTAPLNVRAVATTDSITLTWTAPRRNAGKVTSYTVYYNYTGQPQHTAETVTGMVGYSHKLTDLESGRTYYVWMTAESQDVGRSQPTALLSVTMKADELSSGAIIGIVIGVLAFVAIAVVIICFVRRKFVSSQPKMGDAVGFKNSGYDNTVHISSSYNQF
ncbi:hypothetical protein ACOMHN_054802 [Nucella lapillus]